MHGRCVPLDAPSIYMGASRYIIAPPAPEDAVVAGLRLQLGVRVLHGLTLARQAGFGFRQRVLRAGHCPRHSAPVRYAVDPWVATVTRGSMASIEEVPLIMLISTGNKAGVPSQACAAVGWWGALLRTLGFALGHLRPLRSARLLGRLPPSPAPRGTRSHLSRTAPPHVPREYIKTEANAPPPPVTCTRPAFPASPRSRRSPSPGPHAAACAHRAPLPAFCREPGNTRRPPAQREVGGRVSRTAHAPCGHPSAPVLE